MYVVIKQNVYGHESGYTVGGIYGPFSAEQAETIADQMNALDEYGVEYAVHGLSLTIGVRHD